MHDTAAKLRLQRPRLLPVGNRRETFPRLEEAVINPTIFKTPDEVLTALAASVVRLLRCI
jgi:hypothetical protein